MKTTNVTATIKEVPEGQIERLLSIDATANLLSLSEWTIRKWIFDGKIKSKKLGSRRLIPESEIIRLVAEAKE